MTDTLDIVAIKARAEATVPGPWTVHKATAGIHSQWEHDLPEGSTAIQAPHPLFALGQTVAATPAMYDAEAEFIAAAREDIPALVAEVERLRDMCMDYAGGYDAGRDELQRLERERDEAREECRLCRDDIRRLVELRDEKDAEFTAQGLELARAREALAVARALCGEAADKLYDCPTDLEPTRDRLRAEAAKGCEK